MTPPAKDVADRRPATILAGPVGTALAVLAVALVTFTAFLPVLNNQFLDWDDEETLVTNTHYRGLTWTHVKWMFTAAHMGHWLPLTWASFALDYLVWGMNPFGYHLTNLLLHTSAAVVFYFVALRLLRAAQTDGSDTALRVGAVSAALFFSVHPLRVESVAWATERRDVLAGLWFLLTILLYLRAVSATGGQRRWWLAGSVGCYAPAVLSKGIVMTLPIVLIILDVYPLRRLSRRWRVSGIWVEKVPYMALAFVAAGIAVWALRSIAPPFSARPLPGRIAVVFYGLAFYVRKTVAPFGIWPLYEIAPEVNPFTRLNLVSVLAVTGLTATALLLRRRLPGLLAAWLAYAAMLSPVSGIIQSGPQVVASRYSYLPCLGWALLFGAGVRWIFSHVSSTRSAATWVRAGVSATVTICLAGLAALTWAQARIWHDAETFWSYAVSVTPASSVAHGNLGSTLSREGRLREARRQLEIAVTLRPDYVEALTNLSHVLVRLDRPDEAKVVLRRLGYALGAQGKFDEAIRILQGLVAIDPSDAVAHNGLGMVLYVRGDRDRAIEQFRQAVKIDPGFSDARANLDLAIAGKPR